MPGGSVRAVRQARKDAGHSLLLFRPGKHRALVQPPFSFRTARTGPGMEQPPAEHGRHDDTTGAGIRVPDPGECYKVSLNIIIHMRILCKSFAIIDGPVRAGKQSERVKKGDEKT